MRRLLLLTVFLSLAPGLPAQDLLERASFKHKVRVEGSERWERVAVSPDGTLVAGALDACAGEVKLWDVATGKEVAALAGGKRPPSALVFNADGKRLAAGGDEGVHVWDVGTHKELTTLKAHSGSVTVLTFSPDGKKVGAAGGTQAKVWDVDTGKELASLLYPLHDFGVPGLAFSRDLTTLAAQHHQEIDLWDVATGKARATLSEHRGEVVFLAYSPDDKTLIASSTRYEGRSRKPLGDVKLWDVTTGKERVALKGPFGRVRLAALSPDGKTLALLEHNGFDPDLDLKVVDVATGRQRVIPPVPGCSFVWLGFTAAGKLMVTGVSAEVLTLWEVSLPDGQRR
jgi:WD40 repeat protein